MDTTTYQFPKKFLWGVATASAQIEGAATEDGKGESIWDRFASIPGKVRNGDTPAVACDHYHRYREDAALMKRLGIRHYRMSVAWPRIYPQGRGPVNPKGLDFYDRLIDTLLDHGIRPWVTMYHWDLPQVLEDEGGWRVRSTPEAFAPYAAAIVHRLGDRVKDWLTLNEIPCFIGLCYSDGTHAPGVREPAKVVNQAYHHALLAHGYGVQAVREHGGRGARVGLVHNPHTPLPVTETPADIAAATAHYRRSSAQLLAPIFLGRYPRSFLEEQGADAPQVAKGDLRLISQPTDFLGLNLYSGTFVRAGKNRRPQELPYPKDYLMGGLPFWKFTPQTMYWAVRLACEVYGIKQVYITENGVCYDDTVTASGEIYDVGRREFVRNYLIALHRAIQEGYPVRGYFWWSLMDNFEWAEGYSKRFGIVYTDYATQKRIPKLTAEWYRQVIKHNRIV